MKNDINKAFGDVPQRFSDRIDEALAGLPEKKTKLSGSRSEHSKTDIRAHAKRLLLIAAAMVLVTGAALAIGKSFGILDFLTTRPDVTAQNEISQNVASATKDGLKYTVREAVYDGVLLRYVIAVDAVDSMHYVPINEYDAEFTEMTVHETVGEYAVRTGKQLLNAGFLSPDIEGYGVETGRYAISYEDETLVVYGEYVVPAEAGNEELIRVFFTGWDAAAESSTDEEIVSFTLYKTNEDKKVYTIEPSAELPFQIVGASFIRTSFADYFTVEYSFDELMRAVARDVYADDTIYYITQNGRYAHLDEYCSGMQGAHGVGKGELIILGKEPCPICCGTGSKVDPYWYMDVLSPGDPDEYGIYFHGNSGDCLHLKDADTPIDVRGSRYTNASGQEIVRYVIIMDHGAMPDGELKFYPCDPGDHWYEPIRLG